MSLFVHLLRRRNNSEKMSELKRKEQHKKAWGNFFPLFLLAPLLAIFLPFSEFVYFVIEFCHGWD